MVFRQGEPRKQGPWGRPTGRLPQNRIKGQEPRFRAGSWTGPRQACRLFGSWPAAEGEQQQQADSRKISFRHSGTRVLGGLHRGPRRGRPGNRGNIVPHAGIAPSAKAGPTALVVSFGSGRKQGWRCNSRESSHSSLNQNPREMGQRLPAALDLPASTSRPNGSRTHRDQNMPGY